MSEAFERPFRPVELSDATLNSFPVRGQKGERESGGASHEFLRCGGTSPRTPTTPETGFISSLKRQFSIDDDYIEDLKEEFLYAHEASVQADDRGLIWIGDANEFVC